MRFRTISTIVLLPLVAGCGIGTSPEDMASEPGGKADDASALAAFAYPVPEAPLRSLTIEGSAYAHSNGDALDYVFAPRHVVVDGALYVTNGETGKFLQLKPEDDPTADFFVQRIEWSLFDR